MKYSWFALHVRSRFEKYVETHLQQKGFDVFCPTYVATRKWSDRTKTISVPLFPNYVFCRFDLNCRLPILVTPGVNSIVGCGKAPQSVDEQEIQDIQRITEAGVTTQPWPFLSVGERVRIDSGPLQGLTGIVLREKGHNHLVISVSLLMRSVSVEIDQYSVQPLSIGSRYPEAALADTAMPGMS